MDGHERTHGQKTGGQDCHAHRQRTSPEQHQQQSPQFGVASRKRDVDLHDADGLACAVEHWHRLQTQVEPIHRTLAHIRRSCCQHPLHRSLVRESGKQSTCPFVDLASRIDQQEKGLERSGTEMTGRIDDRLAALQGLHQVLLLFLLDGLRQELVDLGIGRHDFAQEERAREQQQERAEHGSIEQGQSPSKRVKERIA